MNTTLAERLIEAMKGPPKVLGVDLAKACGVKPPSVSGWRTGDTKSLEAGHLLAASKLLGVRPDWLAHGVGPKYPAHQEESAAESQIEQTVAGFIQPQTITDPFIMEAVRILTSLKKSQRQGAIANLKLYVAQLGPPRNGQSLYVAG